MLGTRAQRGDHGESVPRGRRAGEGGTDPWGRAVSGVRRGADVRAQSGAGWAALGDWAAWRGAGRGVWVREKGKGVMGRTGLCWVFLGLGLVSSFLFYF